MKMRSLEVFLWRHPKKVFKSSRDLLWIKHFLCRSRLLWSTRSVLQQVADDTGEELKSKQCSSDMQLLKSNSYFKGCMPAENCRIYNLPSSPSSATCCRSDLCNR
ncbi:hypothetical protein PAMP_010270 [Pampus punctatissimus]